MLDDGIGFSLGPWKPAIEKQLGRGTEFVGLSVLQNQGLANEFGHATDNPGPNKLDSPDLRPSSLDLPEC
jgi:hypothetical protein